MKEFPKDVEYYKNTKVFTEKTVPDALTNTHFTKKGTWGKLIVTKGKLLYHIDGESPESHEITEENYGVIEPQKPHHVEMIGEVEFRVDFYK